MKGPQCNGLKSSTFHHPPSLLGVFLCRWNFLVIMDVRCSVGPFCSSADATRVVWCLSCKARYFLAHVLSLEVYFVETFVQKHFSWNRRQWHCGLQQNVHICREPVLIGLEWRLTKSKRKRRRFLFSFINRYRLIFRRLHWRTLTFSA